MAMADEGPPQGRLQIDQMDRMIGNHFEAGLAAQKSMIERPSTKEIANG